MTRRENGRMEEWKEGERGWIEGRMEGWNDRRKERGWIVGRMEEWKEGEGSG